MHCTIVLDWASPTLLPSPAKQKIHNRNNIISLEKWEIFFSLAYPSAVWLQFGSNPIDIIVDNNFVLHFALIITRQQIGR